MTTLRMIWHIFLYDVRKAFSNVIGVVVLMGLVVVPSLYAWFNIAASWDPYSNTKGLKVAVANSDDGYKSDLIPVKVNIGDTVISTLRANDQLDWQFVSEEKAIDGVNSGEYYAAVVIPKDFSASMMTIFSPRIEHAKLAYYINQKENAIAPKVTDEGADTIADQIDQTFTSTVVQVGLDTASSLSDYLSSDDVTRFVANLTGRIGDATDALTQVDGQLGDYAALMTSTAGVVDAATTLIKDAGGVSTDTKGVLGQAQDGVDQISSALDASASALGSAIDATERGYDAVSGAVDDVYGQVGGSASNASASLNASAGNLEALAKSYEQMANSLKPYASASLPDGGKAMQDVIDRLNEQAARQRELAQRLRDAASKVDGTVTDANKQHDGLKAQIQQSRDGVDALRTSFDGDGGLKAQAGQLASSIRTAAGDVGAVGDRLNAVTAGMSDSTGSLAGDLRAMSSTLTDLRTTVKDASGKLGKLRDSLTTAGASGDLNQIKGVLSSNTDQLASTLAAPVTVNRKPVFAIPNYGSAMAPFYTILAIWVGGIVLVAMMRVGLSKNEMEAMTRLAGAWRRRGRAAGGAGAGDAGDAGAGDAGAGDAGAADADAGADAGAGRTRDAHSSLPAHAGPTLNQQYLGRFVIFALLALLQAGLVCMGDLWYLRIQCEHPFLFLLAGWLASVVFCNIMYTLTVSFGDIGKAIAVLLLVIQVAGSGGTFPIETLPPFFRAVYPFLPFTHGVAAMHAAIAGPYGNEYWVEMGKLALFLVPFLLLGLVLRRPVIRLNDLIIRNLESTKVM